MSSAAARALESTPGRVVACFGKRFLVEVDSGETISCVTRSRRGGVACGDIVRLARTSAGEGVIEQVEARSSLIYRSDLKREKSIAANVGQVVIVVAVTPAPNEDFIDRCLAAAEHADVQTLLVLNKIDRADGRAEAEALVARYQALGYRTVQVCAHRSVDAVMPLLLGQLSVLIGQSGVGKSTLVNRLVPDARARIGATSATTDAGRHTTTSAQLYRIDARSAIIDSPGMHAFGLGHLSAADLAYGFAEFRPFLGRCRFNDCRHREEPGCAIESAVQAGSIRGARLLGYRRILDSLSPARPGNRPSRARSQS